MNKERQQFFIATIYESYNVKIEFSDTGEIIYPEGIDLNTKGKIVSFYAAVLANQSENS